MTGTNMILHHGCPERAGRQERELRVYDLLDSIGIEYWQTDHRAVSTVQEAEDAAEALGVTGCKNLFLCDRRQTCFYLLLMPGEKKFKTKELSQQLGSGRLSFASDTKMVEYLDIYPGAVSVMGLMNDRENHVRLVIDEDVLQEKFLGCHPCVNTSSLKIRMTDLLEKFLPAVSHDYTAVRLS